MRPIRGEFDYINQYYGLSLQRGTRVKVLPGMAHWSGKEGVVAEADGHYLMIRFDGDKAATGPFHPTSGLEYEEQGAAPGTTVGGEG